MPDACPREHRCAARLALTTLLLASVGCSIDDEGKLEIADDRAAVVDVEVLALTYQPWRQRIQAYGRIVSGEKVAIGVELAGTIASVDFREGDTIAMGQPLFRLDARKQTTRLDRASADVASAEAELARAAGTYQRQQALIGRKLIAAETFKLSETAFQTATARLEQARAAERLARQELDDLTVTSPVDGVVELESVEPGQRVRPGDTLAMIQTVDTLQVVTYVREQEVNLLRRGDTAPVTSPGAPARVYQAHIESIGAAADPRTGNFPIKLRIDNADGLLREGMSAQVELQVPEAEQLILVPVRAVSDRNRQRVVFLVREQRAVQVAPMLGLSVEGWAPALAGLAVGDQLIVSSLPLLADGVPVRVVARDAATASDGE